MDVLIVMEAGGLKTSPTCGYNLNQEEVNIQKALGTYPRKACTSCGRLEFEDELMSCNTGLCCWRCCVHGYNDCPPQCEWHKEIKKKKGLL